MSGSKALLVEHQCPQCGGPVTLEETDRLFSCGFCRVRLYITSRGHLRYLLPTTIPAEELHLVPYWRVRGMYFTLRPYEIKSKVLDASLLASGHGFLPYTLGVRSQALKLKYASPGLRAQFLPAVIPLDKVAAMADQVTQAISPGTVFHSSFIGETSSIIYAPLYVKGRAIYDAVLKRPIGQYTLLRKDELSATETKKSWRLSFLPALCPDCGWDLGGGRDSKVLLCRNCDSAWGTSDTGFERQGFSVIPPREKDILHLPFWRLEVSVSGLTASTYADLVRLANLPKVIQPGMEERRLYFWSPAFKVHPRLFLRLAGQMTVLQPEGERSQTLSDTRLYPVTLDAGEAAEGVGITLAGFAVPKKTMFPIMKDVTVKLNESLLVYLPFRESPHDFTQPDMRFCISRTALRRLDQAH